MSLFGRHACDRHPRIKIEQNPISKVYIYVKNIDLGRHVFLNNLLDRVKGPAIPYTPTQQR